MLLVAHHPSAYYYSNFNAEMLAGFGQPNLQSYSSLKYIMEISFPPNMINSPIILQPFPSDPVYTSAAAIIPKSIFKYGPHW